MSIAVVTARWIVTGAKDNTSPVIINDAGLAHEDGVVLAVGPCLLYTSPSPRDRG